MTGGSGAHPRPLWQRIAGGLADPLGATRRWSDRRRLLAETEERMRRARAAGLFPSAALASARPLPRTRPSAPLASADAEVAFAMVATRDHLPFAAVLAESLGRFHPEAARYLFLTDALEAEETRLPGVSIHAAADLDIPWFHWLALALEAHHLCFVVKPFALQRLLEAGFARVVYLDTDLHLLAPLDSLLAALDAADLVLTPHFVRLPEAAPELTGLSTAAYSGPVNAGIVAARAGSEGPAFLATWGRESTSFEALRAAEAHHLEQRLLGLAPGLLAACHLLRDPAVNVAYWNLDERALSAHPSPDRPLAPTQFRARGAPLVAFHFSGYDPRHPGLLSRFASAPLLDIQPAAAALAADYRARLEAQGALLSEEPAYGFARLPSGLPVDARLRVACRLHAEDLFADADPWTPDGEHPALARLFRAAPSAATLQPPLLDIFLRERPDLAPLWPDADIEPRALLPWLGAVGLDALGWRELFARHAPLRLTHESLGPLLEARDGEGPASEPLAEPLGVDRPTWVRRLRAAGAKELADGLESFALELFATSPTAAAIELWQRRSDLQRAFADPLAADAEAYAEWLASDGGLQHDLDGAALASDWRARAGGRSLARIHLTLLRQGALAAAFPLGLAGVGPPAFARELLRYVRAHCEFDLDDLRIYLFASQRWPEQGLAFALELPENRRAAPGEDPLDRVAARLAAEAPDPAPLVRALEAERARRRAAPPSPSAGPAVNLFGFFRSPNGLGASTAGVASALRATGFEVHPTLLTGGSMERGLLLADVRSDYREGSVADVWISYPHYHEDLLARHPSPGSGAPQAVLLAWEQRTGHPGWKRALAGFDRLAAVSSFAAHAIESAVERPVAVLPNVVDVAALPALADKRAAGLDPGRTSFLYCFDIASSFERKNPLGAIAAFQRAFRAGEPVELVLRAASGRERWHRAARERLAAAAAACPLPVRIVDAPLDRAGILALIATADVYLSLHRSEGFGLTLAEAMACGRPVVATAYSGNLDFMTEDNSFLVEASEVELRVSEGPFRSGSVWAEPSLEHAAQQLRRVVEDPAEARRRAERGRAAIQTLFSPSRVGRLWAELLGVPDRSADPAI